MLRLVTIPISHYCEKARWALDFAGLAYEEDAHLPLFHLAATRRAGGGRTVPVLSTPDGTLRQSADIVRFADRKAPADRKLYPEHGTDAVDRWVEELDAELGVDTRLWAYSHVLPRRDLVSRYALEGAPDWQKWLALRSYRILALVMKAKLGIDAPSVALAAQRIDRLFDRVDALLADGRPFMLGDRFTAADLTFASLAAAIVAPAEYHVRLPSPEELDPEAAERVRQWRERPSGRHALEMFRTQRKPSSAVAATNETEQREQRAEHAE